MAGPILLTRSGSGLSPGVQLPMEAQLLVLTRGIADATVALDVAVYLSPDQADLTGATEVGHLKAAGGATDQIPLSPHGIPGVGGQWLIADFTDTGTGHEVWAYIV